MRLLFFIGLGITLLSQSLKADSIPLYFNHPLYVGGRLAYGSTTWFGLIPTMENQNLALAISTPTAVQEGGAVWGVTIGYDFLPCFSLEANYIRYPRAQIVFDENSLFAFEHDNRLFFYSNTESYSLMAKLLVQVPNTSVRIFSGFGVAEIHRYDEMSNQWQLTPTFGFGANGSLTEHTWLEFSFNYIAGHGESELNPAIDFIPFLYSAGITLGYRF